MKSSVHVTWFGRDVEALSTHLRIGILVVEDKFGRESQDAITGTSEILGDVIAISDNEDRSKESGNEDVVFISDIDNSGGEVFSRRKSCT